MWAVILTICALANHDECFERQLTFAEETKITPYVCMAAQTEIAKYMEKYPTAFVKMWRCVNRPERDL